MAGTVVLSSQRALGAVRWARILATGDAANGSFPATTLRSLGVHIDGTLLAIETNPGAVAPTDNYDITLVDADGLDRLGGVGADRDTANTEYAAVGRVCSPDDTLTLTIVNNSVNSATIEIILWWTAAAGASSSTVTLSGTASVSDTTAQGKLDTIITLLGTTVATQVWKAYNTTAAKGAGSADIVWTPASGKKIAITHLTIGTYGTTAARIQLFFAALADATYTAGTDQLVFGGSFAPSTSAYPGIVLAPNTPILATTADHSLKYQSDAALSIDIAVWGYEF